MVGEHGQRHRSGRQAFGADLAHGRQSIHPDEVDVDERNVGNLLRGLLDEVLAGGDDGDDLHVVLERQHRGDAVRHDAVILGDDHTDYRPFAGEGRGRGGSRLQGGA